MKVSLLAAALLALAPTVSNSADLKGGSIELGYSDLVNNDFYDTFAKRSVTGSAEIGFGPTFSVQGDLAYANYGNGADFDMDTNNVALHTIYHPNEATALGVFFGRDTLDGENTNYHGIEVGHGIGAFWGEAYFTRVKDLGAKGDLYGVSGRYTLNDRIEFNASLDNFNVSYLNTNRVSFGMDYRVNDAFTLNGTVGHLEMGYGGASDFISIGAKFTFGPNKGATFEQRDLLRYLPGQGNSAA
ncbi:hypothetical protein B6V72_05045 [Thioclava sp. F34-6]|uniref:hypothetical protein n=1 Tax=Thioclava sp. F34-6 TaxID=1973003 RepID=UPI000B5397E3|nr:hypothetical protein [Thioclava sp. F34-6]OWY14617.1 hypothetical protein B6V72_05045 [Thioclava sp. F34-6]